ncbi:hypothetical protein SAMN03159341_11140 [Paenibacillus sp. 1_12]|uniref:hypothetical protein n=1 Tax=Paenibacillus sp. 1_12 TaxID=1566278 RepID=UPI0008EFE727|nr:hypothetical protein [Paenibacillus sp. 1_12]SFL87457.1 hypothetical protein SAMN03159341_11140 [Paenibacillus sp. 1_12]
MSSIAYSTELHQVVRNLKHYDSRELANFFKDSKWFESLSISAEEAQAVVKLFSKSTKDYIKATTGVDAWG